MLDCKNGWNFIWLTAHLFWIRCLSFIEFSWARFVFHIFQNSNTNIFLIYFSNSFTYFAMDIINNYKLGWWFQDGGHVLLLAVWRLFRSIQVCPGFLFCLCGRLFNCLCGRRDAAWTQHGRRMETSRTLYLCRTDNLLIW